MVQPAVARAAADARHPRPPARQAEPVRLPGVELTTSATPRRRRTSRPSTRRPPTSRRRRSARSTDAALAFARDGGEPLPADVRAGERAAAARGRARPRSTGRAREDEAERARRRLALDELLTLQLALRRRAAEREELVAEPLPPPAELVARYRDVLPVHAHRRAGARDRGDRRRPRADDADAAPAAGRRRLREDRRRALHAAARRRGGPPGRADGADGDPRRAALPHDRGALRRARRPGRAAHVEHHGPRAPRRASARRLGRRGDRRRHARADPARGGVRRPRRRRRRRAAPLRRRAARRARRGTQPARPPHDRDADPADARAHGLRRPRRLGDLGAAGEPQADRHRVGDRGAQLGGVHAPAARTSTRDARRTSSARSSRAPRRRSPVRPRTRRSACARTSSAGTASAASTAA